MIIRLKIGRLKLKGPNNDYNRFLDIFGDAYISQLEQRLDRGVDIYNNPFPPYSEKYQKFRAEHGKNIQGDYLQLTGKMLQSMSIVDHGRNKIVIGFSGARPGGGLGKSKRKRKKQILNAAIAYAHNEGKGRYGPIPQRKFFGVVSKIVTYSIKAALRQITMWSKRR